MRSSSPRFTMAVHRVEAGDGVGEPQALAIKQQRSAN